MSITSNNGGGRIVGLDGQPLTTVDVDGKRYAIVGTVNIHAAVFELKEGEDMRTAITRQQRMVKEKDPALAKQTRSMVFFWAEDDATRDHNRMALLQQVAAYIAAMPPDGVVPLRKDAFELTDEMLGRSEKGTRDQTQG